MAAQHIKIVIGCDEPLIIQAVTMTLSGAFSRDESESLCMAGVRAEDV